MQETIEEALYRPRQWENDPASATQVINNDAGDHDDEDPVLNQKNFAKSYSGHPCS
jgi:hypothetical protein